MAQGNESSHKQRHVLICNSSPAINLIGYKGKERWLDSQSLSFFSLFIFANKDQGSVHISKTNVVPFESKGNPYDREDRFPLFLCGSVLRSGVSSAAARSALSPEGTTSVDVVQSRVSEQGKGENMVLRPVSYWPADICATNDSQCFHPLTSVHKSVCNSM